ncbi:hypothetical protein B0H12DRAFT_1142594 [Mycena haematopus]|nr:hypothetical protein B0H12DRAFT_1142594 [Mycena haematopus]
MTTRFSLCVYCAAFHDQNCLVSLMNPPTLLTACIIYFIRPTSPRLSLWTRTPNFLDCIFPLHYTLHV